MMATLGESPLNSLDEDHPLVATARSMIKFASVREQSKVWWFNRDLVTLDPDVSGYIYTPNDALSVDPTAQTLNYVQRGRRLYQAYAPGISDQYKFTSSVTCWIARLIPFDDLPPMAATLIACAAQMDFQKAYDADQAKFAQLKSEYQQALIALNAEHIRNRGANLLRRASTASALSRMSPRNQLGGLLPLHD